MVNRVLCAAVLAVVLCPGVFGREDFTRLGEKTGPVSISWESVDAEYRVEIRRDGLIFITTRQTENSLNLHLAPGPYEYRISVLDPFGGVVSSSRWQKLAVQHPEIPYFRVTNPAEAWEGEGEIELQLEGAALEEGTVFGLVSGNRRVPAAAVKRGGGIRVLIDIAVLAPGIWDLEAAASSGLSFTYPGALNLRPAHRPSLETAELTEVLTPEFVLVTLKGNHFDREMEVRVECPEGKVHVMAADVRDTGTALVYLDIDKAGSQSCDVSLTNPAGGRELREDAVTLPESEVGGGGGKAARSRPGPRPGPRPHLGFRAGYTPMVSFIPNTGSSGGELINDAVPAWAAAEGAVILYSGWNRPFLRGLGAEVRGVFGGIGPRRSEDDYRAFGMMDLSVFWRPGVRGILAPVFSTGIGNMWNKVSAESADSENLLFFRVGAAMDFAIRRHRLRIGLESAFALDERSVFTMAGLSLGWGMEF